MGWRCGTASKGHLSTWNWICGASCALCWIGMRRTAHGCREPARAAGLLAESGLLGVLSRSARVHPAGGVLPQGRVADPGAVLGCGVERTHAGCLPADVRDIAGRGRRQCRPRFARRLGVGALLVSAQAAV